MRRWLAVLAALSVYWVAVPAAADAGIGFDAATAIAITPGQPGSAAIINDTATAYRLTAATATVYGGPSLTVQTSAGGPFTPLLNPVPIPPGAVLRLQLAGAGTGPATSGFLTVSLTAGASVLHLHRPVTFSPTGVVAGTSSVSRLVRAGVLSLNGEGSAAVAIPLASGTCGSAGHPRLTLVAGDRSATGEVECPGGPDSTTVMVRVDHLPGPGSYQGSVSLGGKDVAVKLDRGLGPVWPVVAIVVGLLLAIAVQALTEADWIRQQRGWLKRQNEAAGRADQDFNQAAAGTAGTWKNYQLVLYIKTETDAVGADIDAVLASRGSWLKQHLVPWPTGYQAKQRSKILARIVALDGFVADWAASASDFKTAATTLDQTRTAASRYAPRLLQHVTELLNPAPAGYASGLETVRAQIAQAHGALTLAADIAGQQDRLLALEADPGLSDPDRELLGKAWQQHRLAAGALSQSVDPILAMNTVAALVQAAAESIASLPEPAPTAPVPTPPPNKGLTTTLPGKRAPETAPLAFRVLAPLRQLSHLIGEQSGPLSFLFILVITTVAGIWSGLALLFLNKPWGHPVDFVAAVAWGFAATTVLTPIVGLLRNWGARAADAAPAKA